MKSYTNILQSKKLAKILPKESADMYYFGDVYYPNAPITAPRIGSPVGIYIPCWSLAALLDVMPHIQEFYPTIEKINDKFVCRYKGSGIWTNGTNPVDACYEMITLLHKENLI